MFSRLGEANCIVLGSICMIKADLLQPGKVEQCSFTSERCTGRAEHQLVQWKLNNIFICSTVSSFSVFYALLQLPLMQINPSSASFQSTNLLCTCSL